MQMEEWEHGCSGQITLRQEVVVVVDTPVAEQAPVVIEPVVEIPVQAIPTPVPAVETVVSGTAGIDALNISTLSKFALHNVAEYMDNMAARKPVDVVTGARHQVTLYRAITSIINSNENDFAPAFGALLSMFHNNAEGAFHETRVFRFFDQMALPENDRKAFQRLLNLIKITADPKARALALTQVDMSATLQHGLSDLGRQKVLNFFGM